MKKSKRLKQHKHPDGIARSYNKKLEQVYGKVLEEQIEEKILKNIDKFVIDGILDGDLLKKFTNEVRQFMLFCNSSVKQVARESFKKTSKYNMKVLKNQLKQLDK